jgi:hypothetical protein
MTPPPDNSATDVEARFRALLFLHAQSPDFADVDLTRLPEFAELTVAECLRKVTDAPGELIPVSARLAVLYDLAKAGTHQGLVADDYRRLVGSTLALKPGNTLVPPEDLVDDLARSATVRAPFNTTRSAAAFDHAETAFIGEDVCTIRQVKIGDVRATWVYAEFETDATCEAVSDWVDPRKWSTWGPLFFRRMDLLLSPPAPVDISPPPVGDQHWQGVFHEEVRLVRLVNTLLRCSYWRGPRAAAMTYDLDLSLDGEIDVDRGFLLVTDLGPARRVQVLKIVSFTEDWWDYVAALVCPFWTDWIRAAVQGGTKSVPLPPTHTPSVDPTPCEATVDAWVEFAGEAAKPYVDMGSDVTSRIRSREYSTPDLLADGTRLWSQLAKDWARAWTTWSETMDDVARKGLDASFVPPGVPRDLGRRTTAATSASTAAPKPGGAVVTVAGLTASDRPVPSDLVAIEPGTATIPARDLTVTVEPDEDGSLGARVRTTNTSVPHGLYVGDLKSADGRELGPVHLYVSRATEA